MTRIHDMGGRFGDGPVVPEPEGVMFHADWHPRALAVTLACGSLGLWNIDVSRHARESLAPSDYARFSYYEKWMAALADMLVDTGAVSRAEMAAGAGAEVSALAEKCLTCEAVAGVLAKGAPADRPSDVPARFAVGSAVRLNAVPENRAVAGGHTRLPAYAAGAVGRVVRVHGCHVLPDSSAHRLGDAAEPLYAVAVSSADIWAHPEHPNDEVILDLWDSYLAPV